MLHRTAIYAPPAFDENKISQLEGRISIIMERDRLVEKAADLNFQDDGNLPGAAEKIGLLAREGKIEEAGSALGRLREKVISMEERKEDSIAIAERAKAKAQGAKDLAWLGGGLAEKVSLLEGNFAGLRRDEFEQVYAFSPITTQRLVEMRKVADAALAKGAIAEKMAGLIFAGNAKEALALSEKAGIEKLLADVQGAEKEASAAIEKLKENALSSYNVAVSRRDPSKATTEMDAQLLSAKEALEEKGYLKSMLGSQKAMAAGAAVLAQPEIPFAVYPIVLIIVGAALYLYYKTEKGKEPKQEIRVRKLSEGENDEKGQEGFV